MYLPITKYETDQVYMKNDTMICEREAKMLFEIHFFKTEGKPTTICSMEQKIFMAVCSGDEQGELACIFMLFLGTTACIIVQNLVGFPCVLPLHQPFVQKQMQKKFCLS